MTAEAVFAAARANAARSCQSERHRGSFSKPGRFWPSGFDFLGWAHFKAWKERNHGLEKLGFPWISSSESSLFNGYTGFSLENNSRPLCRPGSGPRRGASVLNMQKRRIAHQVGFCNSLSIEALLFPTA